MVWFRRSGWRHSATTLLSRKISNYIAALFIVAIVIPWVGFASLSPTNRSQQIGYAASDLQSSICSILDEIQASYFNQVLEHQKAHTRRDIHTFEELKAFFTPKNEEKPEIHGGFVLAKWCGDVKTEEMLKELKLSIRCLPLQQSGTTGKCILTGKPATLDAIFAKSY